MVFRKNTNNKKCVLALCVACLVFLNIAQNILASDILVNTNDLSSIWLSSANNNTLILNVDQNLNSQTFKTLTGGSNGNYHIKANGAETILGAAGANEYVSVDIISLTGNNNTLWLEGENAANPLTLKHETNAAGSAVRINGNGNTLRATNISIADNYYDNSSAGNSSGGAIYVMGTSNTLIFDGEKTVFDHNGYRSRSSAKTGGGIYLVGGNTEAGRSFINFDAKETVFSNHGSGISDEGRGLYTEGVVTVNFNSEKTLFLDNNAGSGGAITASGSSWGIRSIYNFNSDETLFKGNTARLKSAAMSVIGIIVNFNGKITFEENNNNRNGDYLGGVMMTEGSAELFFNNDTYFLRNQEGLTGADTQAPAVLTIYGSSTVWFSGENTVFQENHSYLGDNHNITLEGGAIMINDYSEVYFNGKNVLFDKNTTRGSLNANVMSHTGGGAAIGALRGNMVFDVDSLQFIENQSINGSGGAIKVSDGNIEIHAREAIFRKNSMFVESHATPNYFTDPRERGGGAILINKGVLTLDAETILFDENSSGANAFKGGGAIMLNGEWKRGDSVLNCISNNLTFSNNHSDYVGGAISSTGSLLNFQSIQTTFINNNAGTNGGAIYAGYCDDYYGNKVPGEIVFQKANILFDGNHAGGRGGAIYMDGGTVTFECEVNQGLPILPTSYYYNGATFINNTDSLGASVIHFSNEPDSQFNLFLKPNGDIHFYGPVTSDGDNGNINKKGLGRAFFYGNNDYGGKVNIDEGPLTIRNDMTNPLLQMGSFGNATTVYNIDGPDAYINPAINVDNRQVASLYGSAINISNGGRYNPGYVSQQSVGAVDYGGAISLSTADPTLASKLNWDNPLASAQLISDDGGNEWDLKMTVKRGLGGFQGLSPNLDLVRGWDELHDTIRCAMDDIYFYGRATDDQKYAMYQIFERGPGQYLTARQSEFRSLSGKLRNQALSGFFIDRPSQENGIVRYSPKQQRFWEGAGEQFANTSGTRLWGNYGKHWTVKHGLTGYDYAPFDLTMGYDTFDYKGVLGFAVQYHEGFMVDRYHDYAASSNKIQGVTGAIYGSYVPGDWYVTWCGMLDGSRNKMTTRAMFTPDIAYGEYQSFGFGLMTEVGREFRLRRLHVTPYTGLDLTFWLSSSFTETGSDLNRRFGSGDAHVVEVPFGMRFSRLYTVGGSASRLQVAPSVDLAYIHNFGDPNANSSASFVYSASSPKWYPGNGVFADRDAFRLRTNLTLARSNQTLVWNIGYGLDIRSGYSNNQFETTLTLAW